MNHDVFPLSMRDVARSGASRDKCTVDEEIGMPVRSIHIGADSPIEGGAALLIAQTPQRHSFVEAEARCNPGFGLSMQGTTPDFIGATRADSAIDRAGGNTRLDAMTRQEDPR
jgi:hypothetical protein